MKVLLVANVPTHYRVPLYRELARRVDHLRVVFYSDGAEWYWKRTETPTTEGLDATVLRGAWVGRTRITPSLIGELMRTDADVIIKDPNGKFALPATYVIARIRRKPFVFWASLWEHPTTPVHRLSKPLLEHIYRSSDAIVTYGHHVTRHVAAAGVPSSKIWVSPQAVSARPGSASSEHAWADGPAVLYVGRLEHWKGVGDLLAAISQVAGPTLDVIGEGDARLELERTAEELGVSTRVRFLGKIANSTVQIHYARAAVVVVPSLRTSSFSEPWALVVNEAMHAGCLVIASDAVGAVQDGLVTDGRTGLTFTSGDAAGLAATLRVVADATNHDRLQRIADAGRASAASYTHEAAAAAFVEASAHAIASHAGRPASVSLRNRIAASPLARPVGRLLRYRVAAADTALHAKVAFRWAATSRETTNYNYPLSELNYRHLAWFVSAAAGFPVRRVRELFAEALCDGALRQHIEKATLASPFSRVSEPAPHFGRRLAWYALVRLQQPSLVVETGTERGLGSCLLAAALLRNGNGELVTVDPSPTAGWLISGEYARITTMVRASADEVLRDLGRPLGILVHDVHATREQEEAEYQAAMPWLSDGALIINDNAHGFDVLPALCEAQGWQYLHFREVPVEHWYPGAGLGVAVVTASGTDR